MYRFSVSSDDGKRENVFKLRQKVACRIKNCCAHAMNENSNSRQIFGPHRKKVSCLIH